MKRIQRLSFSFLILLFAFVLSGAAFAAETYHYATTDMTWAEFYAGEIEQTSTALKEAGLDAYTSATATRMFASIVSADGSNIQGLKTIQVRMTEDIYNALKDNPRYSFDTTATYTKYKDVNADGTFGAMTGIDATTKTGANVILSSGANAAWGTYYLAISDDTVDYSYITTSNKLGAVIETDNGSYGLRHVNNMWRNANDLGLTVDDAYVEIHGTHVTRDYAYTSDLAGKTIKKITYIVKDAPNLVLDGLNIKLNAVPTVKPANETITAAANVQIPMTFDLKGLEVTYDEVVSVQQGGGRGAVTLTSADYSYDATQKTLTLVDPIGSFYRVVFKSSSTDIAPNIRAAFYTEGTHYATTNMTWAEFYAGEIGKTSNDLETAGLDAYTSATTRNYTSFPLTNAAIVSNDTNTANVTKYYGAKAVQVAMSEEVYNLVSKDSRYSFSAKKFDEYKTLNADGTFGAMSDSGTITSTDVTVTVSSGGSSAWGTYTLWIDADLNDALGILSSDSGHGTARNLLGATISTDKAVYGMRPNSNTFSEAAIALTINDKYIEPHNADNRPYEYTADLAGQTVKQITYILKDTPDIVIDNLDIKLAEWTDASATVKEPTNGSGFLTTGGIISFDVEFSGLPAGTTYNVKSVTKPGARRHSTIAMEYKYVDGVLTLTSPDQIAPVTYTVIFEDSADKYVDLKTTFTLYSTVANSLIMSDEDNKAELSFLLTPVGAVSSIDAVLESKNFVNASSYTTSSDNSSEIYTAGVANEIKNSGFKLNVKLSDVPSGKTAILGFSKQAVLTAETLGSEARYNTVSTLIKTLDSVEEGGVTYYLVDSEGFKKLGISVMAADPSRDLTNFASAGAAFINDVLYLTYGAMLADSNSIEEGVYTLSPEGEMLLNDGVADGYIKAAWYLTVADTASNNGSGTNTNNNTNNNTNDNTSGGTTKTEMTTPVNVSIPEASAKAQESFKKESVVEKLVETLEALLGITIPEGNNSEVKALPDNVAKTTITLTQSEMEKAGATFTASEDSPVVLETVTITESAVYYIPVPKENLTVGMKIFIHLLKNAASVRGTEVYLAADTEEVEAVFANSNGEVITTVPDDKDVNIVAYMENGNSYTPVVTSAENDNEGGVGGSGGGCNAGIFAPVLLLGAVLLMKRR